MRPQRLFYGWIVVAVSFVTLFLVVGTRFSLGVFYVAILDDYHWTRAETAGAFSLMLVVHAVFSLAVGALFDRFGPRLLFPLGGLAIAVGFAACSQIRAIWQLYVFLGIVAALGITTLAFAPHMALVSAWFERWRGAATGIAYAGIGGGQLILAPLIQTMINWLGWRGAFLALAAVVLAVVVPLTAMFQRQRPQDLGLLPDGRSPARAEPQTSAPPPTSAAATAEVGLGQAIRCRPFWLLLLTVGGLGVTLNTLLLHLMAYLTDIGYSKFVGATLLGVVGGLRSLGGMSLGSWSDRIGREKAYGVAALLSIAGVVLLMSIQETSQTVYLYGFALLYGLGHGAMGPIYAAATADLFPGRSLGTILGLLEAAYGLGGALGTYLAGVAYDVTGQYTGSFILIVAASAASSLGLWLAAPRRRRASGARG